MRLFNSRHDNTEASLTLPSYPLSLQQLSFSTFHRKTLAVSKQIITAVSLTELFTDVVCKSHPHTEEVSEISNRPVLVCIKNPKPTQDEKTEEQRNSTVSPRLSPYMTRAKISLVRALTSRPGYKPTVRDNNSGQEVFIMHFN